METYWTLNTKVASIFRQREGNPIAREGNNKRLGYRKIRILRRVVKQYFLQNIPYSCALKIRGMKVKIFSALQLIFLFIYFTYFAASFVSCL
jgi:hypothetical protein